LYYNTLFPIPKLNGLRQQLAKILGFFDHFTLNANDLTTDQILASGKFFETFYASIKDNIISKIKIKDIAIKENKSLDSIKNKEVLMTLWRAEDKEFFKLFADTQMLTVMLETMLKQK